MRIAVIAIDRIGAGPLAALQNHYAERIAWKWTIRECVEKRTSSAAERMEREGELLLKALPKGATIIALDGRGKLLSSEAFAAQLGKWQDSGIADLAFLIGGADGLAESVRQKANLILSLGAMTWPHLLVRGMLL